MNGVSSLINIVEDAEIAYAELPDWRHVFEVRRQSHKALAVPSDASRFVGQMLLDGCHNCSPVVRPQFRQLIGGKFVNVNLERHA